eukprot:CAMPEP_0201722528 /NCGR_PEP_ID=MMETSP0593-20130828/6887_1 /ASSEMBLY_ACC=CAM_ASM_000672 /TAXON_ID=267983 /ORGANISM="Skeletonema japonicum, Strain CCMP2506" /LENGTH=228 /DNA_ID=CAMNT_0048213505 /DNA_START=63 /DNA_END=749 /DNA_ORIENTATION=-
MSLFGVARSVAKSTPAIGRHANSFFAITSPSSTTITPLATTIRSKHSATQVKRLFKNNPARLRILKKQQEGGGAPTANTSSSIPERVYPQIFQPTFLSNGWSAPPPPEVQIPNYPFLITRTAGKPNNAVGFLPVYRDVRVAGTKRTTIIRNVQGDIPAFLSELCAVLNLSIGKKKGILTSASTGKHGGGEAGRGVNSENPIRIRTGGAIEVNGDRAKEVKLWLAGLGF